MTTKQNEGSKKPADGNTKGEEARRQHLLARMAGNIASGILSAPSESTETTEAIATIAVDVAEAILQKIGL